MGGAIIKAVCRGTNPENVAIFDHSEEKMRVLSESTGCETASSEESVIRGAEFVFLCMKPRYLPAVLHALLPELKRETDQGNKKVIVSIAAGVTVSSIEAVLAEGGLSLPVIRLLPNTPVAVGKGLILMTPSRSVSDEEITALCKALEPGGMVSVVDEAYIDPATPVFSCSPAYVYMFIEALADGGVMSGLPRDKAQKFAAQAVLGSAAMVLETGKHPGALKDEVCSPGGSTIVGVEELERKGFRGAVASAVFEAYQKTAKLGK